MRAKLVALVLVLGVALPTTLVGTAAAPEPAEPGASFGFKVLIDGSKMASFTEFGGLEADVEGRRVPDRGRERDREEAPGGDDVLEHRPPPRLHGKLRVRRRSAQAIGESVQECIMLLYQFADDTSALSLSHDVLNLG